jgi:hypothetical protein
MVYRDFKDVPWSLQKPRETCPMVWLTMIVHIRASLLVLPDPTCTSTRQRNYRAPVKAFKIH